MKRCIAASLVVCALSTLMAMPAQAQEREEGLAERLGEKIDLGLDRAASEFREQWTQLRSSIEKMGVEGRVYSRLRWDKHVKVGNMEIEIEDENIVVLRGTVRDAASKKKAVQLANDTVGVSQVIDELTVLNQARR